MRTPSLAALFLGLTLALTACPQPGPAPITPSLSSSATNVQGGTAVTITATNFSGTPTFSVAPANAGTLTTNGNTATFTPNAAFTGIVTITATNGTETSSVAINVTASASTVTSFTGTLLEAQGQNAVPWTRGAGTLTAPSGFGNFTFGNGNVTSNGAFTVNLAAPAANQLFAFETSCAGTITVSDPAARGNTVESVGVTAGAFRGVGFAYDFDRNVPTNTIPSGGYYYANRPVTVSGTETCAADGYSVTYNNLVLQQGWNPVRIDVVINSATNTTYVYSNAAVPSDWIVTPSQAQPLATPRGGAKRLVPLR